MHFEAYRSRQPNVIRSKSYILYNINYLIFSFDILIADENYAFANFF